MHRLKVIFVFTFAISFWHIQTAQAVPPPDFIYAVGAQLTQVFAVSILFLSAAFSVFYKFLKVKFALINKHKLRSWVGAFLGIGLISVGVAYGYSFFQEKKAYKEWVAESAEYAQLSKERNTSDENGDVSKELVNRLAIGSSPEVDDEVLDENVPFISYLEENQSEDSSIEFIKKYYESIAIKDFETAYALSKQSVSSDTFKSWYEATTKITLDNLARIDEQSSSLELTLYEGVNYVRYGVLMALKFENGVPVQIENSSVQVLSKGKLEEKGGQYVANAATPQGTLYDQNQKAPMSTSNNEFQAILDSGRTDFVVLDAREDLENENGHFPGSLHIRYADLQAGKWIELPSDKPIYVFCWSGIRGQEVAEFLRSKNLFASYLAGGASEWVAFGGRWNGNINFAQTYTEDRYRITYTTQQTKNYVREGVFLVDTREPWRYAQSHIEGSLNIPIMHTPTINLVSTFNQVPPHSKIITVCDDYVNCFDAKITGVELEARGHTFIGRYNKPWEY